MRVFIRYCDYEIYAHVDEYASVRDTFREHLKTRLRIHSYVTIG